MRWAFLLSGVLLLAAPAHAATVLSIGDGDTITATEGISTTSSSDDSSNSRHSDDKSEVKIYMQKAWKAIIREYCWH